VYDHGESEALMPAPTKWSCRLVIPNGGTVWWGPIGGWKHGGWSRLDNPRALTQEKAAAILEKPPPPPGIPQERWVQWLRKVNARVEVVPFPGFKSRFRV